MARCCRRQKNSSREVDRAVRVAPTRRSPQPRRHAYYHERPCPQVLGGRGGRKELQTEGRTRPAASFRTQQRGQKDTLREEKGKPSRATDEKVADSSMPASHPAPRNRRLHGRQRTGVAPRYAVSVAVRICCRQRSSRQQRSAAAPRATRNLQAGTNKTAKQG